MSAVSKPKAGRPTYTPRLPGSMKILTGSFFYITANVTIAASGEVKAFEHKIVLNKFLVIKKTFFFCCGVIKKSSSQPLKHEELFLYKQTALIIWN